MMPTQKSDAVYFNELGQSQAGKYLVGFLERLCVHYGSIETLDKIDDKIVEARKQALGIIKTELIARLKTTNEKAAINDFE